MQIHFFKFNFFISELSVEFDFSSRLYALDSIIIIEIKTFNILLTQVRIFKLFQNYSCHSYQFIFNYLL